MRSTAISRSGAAGRERFRLILRGNDELAKALAGPRLQRAIGVIYRPETERHSHYFQTRLPRQFDALVHLDATRALVPLDRRRGDSETMWAMTSADLQATVAHMGMLARAASRTLAASPVAARNAALRAL